MWKNKKRKPQKLPKNKNIKKEKSTTKKSLARTMLNGSFWATFYTCTTFCAVFDAWSGGFAFDKLVHVSAA
jgi:hypothetical protein